MARPIYLNLVLHAHLPYVRHPEYADALSETWLFEAINECYLPLLRMLDRLARDQVDYRLTLSLSPTLLSQLDDPLLKQRFRDYNLRRIRLAEQEIERLRHRPKMQRLARWYSNLFVTNLDDFEQRYQTDLPGAFAAHRQTGRLVLITTAATHGFLPLLRADATAIGSQIRVGLDAFRRRFGFASKGFWLPECGYYPGLERELAAHGIGYFYTENHAILHAEPVPAAGVYAPVQVGGVQAFARHPALSAAVWCAHQGYPGHPYYREYHRDIGFELSEAVLRPCLLDGDVRVNTGIKYHRVTGHEQKALYEPERAAEQAWRHAEQFVMAAEQVATSAKGRDAVLLNVPFDAELFGHWWFEGPIWLEAVLRCCAQRYSPLQLTSAQHWLQSGRDTHCAQLAASSWGEKGYNQYWLNAETCWIYPKLRQSQQTLSQLARQFVDLDRQDWRCRALNQAARNLLLAQASDWPFMLSAKTLPDYARQRVENHLARFNYLQDSVLRHRINSDYLEALEYLDNIFPALDFRDYAVRLG
ncbi:MAG: 1,4-alpha-glucan branching protein domain-containing protein [Methylococcales bacterium]|nr:1,4-alpha-glucan branching protein domain-containing protein [Methylococcales bacterium]